MTIGTAWADVWADVWQDVWATTETPAPTPGRTVPDGGGGSRRIKFNGRFYDSIRDELRLKRDIEDYNRRKVESEKPPEKVAKPKKKAKPARIKLPKPEPFRPDPVLEIQGAINALILRDAELNVDLAKMRRMQAEIDADDLEVLFLA